MFFLKSLTLSTAYWTPPEGLFFGLLVVGALLTAGIGVFVFSFYIDEYWEDEDFREQLRTGRVPDYAKKNRLAKN